MLLGLNARFVDTVTNIRKPASLVATALVLVTSGCAYLRPPAPDQIALAHEDNGVVPPSGLSVESGLLSLVALPFFNGTTFPPNAGDNCDCDCSIAPK